MSERLQREAWVKNVNAEQRDKRATHHAEVIPAREPARAESFEELSAEADPGIVREFIEFLRHNKKWWLTPILLVTLLLVLAAVLLPSPVAPFIYTLF